jgi:predicted NAD/FAD-dependent oxidoreductase
MHCCTAAAAAAGRLATKRAQSNEGAERLRRLETDYEWVVREKANFGKGEYDFEKVDVAEVFRCAAAAAAGTAVVRVRHCTVWCLCISR